MGVSYERGICGVLLCAGADAGGRLRPPTPGQWGVSAAVGAALCLGVWFALRKSLVRFVFTEKGFMRSGKYRRLVRWEEVRGAGSYAPGPMQEACRTGWCFC